jgi:hypothetical protein
MTRLSIEMLPAAQGDGLWVEWTHTGRPYRVLIDGGPGKTYPALRSRVQRLPDKGKRIDMMTITHVDTDHIDGAVTLLLDDLNVEFGDIWFNGRNHVQNPLSPVSGSRYLGGAQGQVLSAILALPRFSWNLAFEGRAIVVDSGKRVFPVKEIGGLTFTILSPRVEQLQKLAGTWDLDIIRALKNMELIPEGERETDVAAMIQEGGFELVRKLLASRYPKRINPPPEWKQPGEDDKYLGDTSNPNGSSIAFLVEDQRRDLAVLFTGDAHAPVLFKSIMELLMQRGKHRLRLDALKLPHHGSRHNISAELLGQLDCDTFLISSDGSAGYNHPDDETIQQILAEAKIRGTRPALHFNYLSHRTKSWALKSSGNGERYEAYFPEPGEGEHGLVVRVG